MFPAYIIEEILKRERDTRYREEVYIERPELDEPLIRIPNDSDDISREDRGVAIIDYTI